jgi:hypothetical protein
MIGGNPDEDTIFGILILIGVIVIIIIIIIINIIMLIYNFFTKPDIDKNVLSNLLNKNIK